MSNYTVANLPRITRDRLADMIRSKKPGVAVVDVRDSDFIGGHIVGCKNVPMSSLDYRLPELVRDLGSAEMVVFHCALSQQRGPTGALRYLRERERMTESGQLGATANFGSVGQKSTADHGEVKQTTDSGDAKQILPADGRDIKLKQEVFVLEGGFHKWQELYGEDKELTEGYHKDLWVEE